jgi:hypothetical protein
LVGRPLRRLLDLNDPASSGAGFYCSSASVTDLSFSERSKSSGVISITGIAFSWIGDKTLLVRSS